MADTNLSKRQEAVYNYLKKMVEKDEEIEKYENKLESSKKANQKSVK